jgi:hypothetical protein
MKVENLSTYKTKINFEELVATVIDALPKNHTSGISKVVFVDRIKDKAIAPDMREKLPILYHPKTPGTMAWLEVALGPMLEAEGFWRKFAAKRGLRTNLMQSLVALIGQHYHLNFSHGMKKNQFEPAIRSYLEKGLKSIQEKDTSFRARLMKPVIPYLERFGKWMAKQQREATKRQLQKLKK